MEAETSVEDFFDKIDDWVKNSGFIKQDINKEKINIIINREIHDHKLLSEEDLLCDSLFLYKYADSLQQYYNREKSILEYAENSILYIISGDINKYGDQYTKYDIKYNIAIRNDPICKHLIKLVSVSRARMSDVEGRIYNIKKIADILHDLSKRKKYVNY